MLQVFSRFQKPGTCWRIRHFFIHFISKEKLRDRFFENTQSNIVLELIQWNRFWQDCRRIILHKTLSDNFLLHLSEISFPVNISIEAKIKESQNQLCYHQMEKGIAQRRMILPFRSENSQGSWFIALCFVWTLPGKKLRSVGNIELKGQIIEMQAFLW